MRIAVPLRASLASLTVAGLLAACAAAPSEPAPESSATPGAADTPERISDNTVVLYSGREEALIAPLIEIFTQETGITVEVRYAGTSELAAQLLEEGQATPAGVFLSQDAGALGALSDAGLFETLDSDITDRVDGDFSSTDGSWVGLTGRARVVVYDSQRVGEDQLPQTVEEIVADEWAGEVAVAPTNASFQSFVTAFRVIEGEEAADAWVSALAAGNPPIFEKNGAILEAVNDGIHPMGLINHYYWYRLAAERGEDNMRAKLHFTDAGDPASIVNVTGAGVLTPHALDQDAWDLVAFLVSDQAQRYFVDVTYEYPLVPGIEAPAGLPALADLAVANFDLSDLRTLKESQSLLQKYGLIL